MSSNSILYSPYTLPCGITVRNRVVKAAMEENMSSKGCVPGESLYSLYRYWAHGDLGMVITGNVMVDKEAMTGPGGVVLHYGVLDTTGGPVPILTYTHDIACMQL